jgi:penicillin amidase
LIFKQRTGLVRGLLFAAVLAVVSHVAARRVGPVPALGPFLDPASGVWSAATNVELPRQEAVTLPGLAGPVQVLFDDRAVPHIFAATSEDAARALGYVVARDRLFQMEMRWRTAAGRLAELAGEDLLAVDQGMRRLGLAWSAERDFERFDRSSPVMRDVAAYAAGVNAFIEGLGRRDLPLEYRLLGARPSAWKPVYSLYLLKVMGWNLTYWNGDLRRLRLQAHVGEAAAAALFPVHSPIQQPIQPNGESGPRSDFTRIPPPRGPDIAALELVRDLEAALGPLAYAHGSDSEPPPLGSNNWAVAPARTAGGHALLSGDPHLELTLPAIWHEAHIAVAGELDVYGVTIPSVPAVLIGFNRDVAWSFTNTGADVIDFYEEEFDEPEAPTRYLVDGEWRPLTQRVEEYRGRGGRILAVDTLYHTHRGPVVTREDRRLSMRWTVLESSVETRTFWDANRAGSVEEWLDALAPFAAPAQNGIVADRDGTIAIRSTGRFPHHPDGIGLEVRDGSVGASDWIGFWPLERYPTSVNPEQGYLASANQEPIDPQVDPTYLGANWPTPWRAMRINSLLAEDSAVTPDAMRRYQTDPGNARADMFLPFFLDAVRVQAEVTEVDTRAREAARLLAEWDRLYTKENERAVLFEYAVFELNQRVWDELLLPPEEGRSPRRVFTPSSTVLASLLHQPESVWWDDRRTPDVLEERDGILVECLADALDRVKENHGELSDGGWRWDGIRHANIYHMLDIPSLSALDLPVQGGSGNLNPSSGSGRHGASWRMVVELGPEMRAWSIYPGGQSGNPMSPYYADRIPKWLDGELDPVLFPRSASELDPSRVISVLDLEPER